MAEESLKPEISLEEQLKGVGDAIVAWVKNIESIDAGSDSDGSTKSMIFDRVEGLQGVAFDDEQRAAIEEIRDISLATGIDTGRIITLAAKFGVPSETD